MRAFITGLLAAGLLGGTAEAQSYSSNCMAIGSTMVHCDSEATDQNWNGLAVGIKRLHDRHVQKKIAKMIQGGDCRSAYAYALEEGFDWAREVQQVCSTALGSGPLGPSTPGR